MFTSQDNQQNQSHGDETRLDRHSFGARPQFEAYHVHVYFNADEAEVAERVRVGLKEEFGLRGGSVREQPVGPHTKAMFVFTVNGNEMAAITEWLSESTHREGLSVLIHPRSGDELLDHTALAHWIGDPVSLDLSKL